MVDLPQKATPRTTNTTTRTHCYVDNCDYHDYSDFWSKGSMCELCFCSAGIHHGRPGVFDDEVDLFGRFTSLRRARVAREASEK